MIVKRYVHVSIEISSGNSPKQPLNIWEIVYIDQETDANKYLDGWIQREIRIRSDIQSKNGWPELRFHKILYAKLVDPSIPIDDQE